VGVPIPRVNKSPAATVTMPELTNKYGAAMPVLVTNRAKLNVAMLKISMRGMLRTPDSMGLALSIL
jgi:hypothetical protein